jgi:hypothetical protein
MSEIICRHTCWRCIFRNDFRLYLFSYSGREWFGYSPVGKVGCPDIVQKHYVKLTSAPFRPCQEFRKILFQDYNRLFQKTRKYFQAADFMSDPSGHLSAGFLIDNRDKIVKNQFIQSVETPNA